MPVPANYRWLFEDPVVPEEYRVHFNPNKMTSPIRPRTIDSVQTIRTHWRIRQTKHHMPFEWTFSGVIRHIEHHDALVYWGQKGRPYIINDHLGRSFQVASVAFKPNEQRPQATIPDRFTYDFTVLVLERLS